MPLHFLSFFPSQLYIVKPQPRPTYFSLKFFNSFFVIMGFEQKHLSFLVRVKCLTRTKHWSQGSARKTKKQNESAALLSRDMRHTLSGSVAMF